MLNLNLREKISSFDLAVDLDYTRLCGLQRVQLLICQVEKRSKSLTSLDRRSLSVSPTQAALFLTAYLQLERLLGSVFASIAFEMTRARWGETSRRKS